MNDLCICVVRRVVIFFEKPPIRTVFFCKCVCCVKVEGVFLCGFGRGGMRCDP